MCLHFNLQGRAKERSPVYKFPPQCCQAIWPTNAQPISQFWKVEAQFSELSAISYNPMYIVHVNISKCFIFYLQVQGGWGGWPTGNGKKLGSCQAQLGQAPCLAVA